MKGSKKRLLDEPHLSSTSASPFFAMNGANKRLLDEPPTIKANIHTHRVLANEMEKKRLLDKPHLVKPASIRIAILGNERQEAAIG
ncbi:hypothetical protein K7X08_002687 [Anisodus acutangulus]|uniref:Uncharacterized protein n=1 Tax=Anisodus acutangulus TaxID=402998 RepID=A0A9Q1L2I0_9SOLA|nr:hypothetical protein K7X08_002687 [Anisodus acutangulus]